MLVNTERLCHSINQRLYLSDPDRSISLQDPDTLVTINKFQYEIHQPPLGQLAAIENCELLQNFWYPIV